MITYKYDDLKKEWFANHMLVLAKSGHGKTSLEIKISQFLCSEGMNGIIFDTHGDIASVLFPRETNYAGESEIINSFYKETDINLYTVNSDVANQICLDPFSGDNIDDKVEVLSSIISPQNANELDLESLKAVLEKILENKDILTFYNLCEKLDSFGCDKLIDMTFKKKCVRKLKIILSRKSKREIFVGGVPFVPEELLGESGKPKLSIISLKYLNSLEEQQYVFSMIISQIRKWMMSTKVKTDGDKIIPRVFITLDECKDFIPAGSVKPCSKEVYTRFLMDSRKFGIINLPGTQSPGDVDYKVFDNVGSYALGQINSLQSLSKVKALLSESDIDLGKINRGDFFFSNRSTNDGIMSIGKPFNSLSPVDDDTIRDYYSKKKTITVAPKKIEKEKIEKKKIEKPSYKNLDLCFINEGNKFQINLSNRQMQILEYLYYENETRLGSMFCFNDAKGLTKRKDACLDKLAGTAGNESFFKMFKADTKRHIAKEEVCVFRRILFGNILNKDRKSW